MFDHGVNPKISYIGRSHMLTIPQDCGTVGNSGNFIHAVADIDNRHALGFQFTQKGKQTVHIRHCQRSRGFVQYQNPRILRDRFNNLGQLLLPCSQISDNRGRVNVDL